MSAFIVSHLLFLLALAGTLFVPGWFLLHLFCTHFLSPLERSIFSVPVSFALTTLTILVANKLGLPLTLINVFGLLMALTFIPAIALFFHKKHTKIHKEFFSKAQIVIIAVLIVLTILIKTVFLTNTIFPTATDLGHHMFWAQKIVLTSELPPYTKIKVLSDDPTHAAQNTATFTAPEPVADFIVGEHIIFAAIALISGQSVVSAFPSLILLAINIVTVLALFAFALRLFRVLPYGTNAAIFTLFLIGPLYAISGAQVKFVSGGVIGNVIGNLLIVSILYFLYRAFSEKSRVAMFFTAFLSIALVYTHHLSTFILAYVLAGTILVFVLFNLKKLLTHISSWRKVILTPETLLLLAGFVVFLLFVYMPSYLNSEAITSSVGAPEKSTRTGIPFIQLMYMSGEARFVFGIIGAVFVILLYNMTRIGQKMRTLLGGGKQSLNIYAFAILLGWVGMIFFMTTAPALLQVNIISSRIATYITFPLALCGGLFLAWLLPQLPKLFPRSLAYTIVTLLLIFLLTNGLRDNNTSLTAAPKTQSAVQTFHGAQYLAEHTPRSMWILKDHNYTVADTWMKVFVNTDYSNPLSRSFFRRYESHPTREHCTLAMISDPASALAQSCFRTLTIGPVVVNTEEDAAQFLKNDGFIKVYENNDTSIFWRK